MADLDGLIAALESATRPSSALDCRLHQMFRPSDEVLTDPGSVREHRPATFTSLGDFPVDSWAPAFSDTLARYIGAPAYTSDQEVIVAAIKQRWPDRFWSVGVFPRRYGSQSRARLWRWDLEQGELDVITAAHRPDCPAVALCLAAVYQAATKAAEDA